MEPQAWEDGEKDIGCRSFLNLTPTAQAPPPLTLQKPPASKSSKGNRNKLGFLTLTRVVGVWVRWSPSHPRDQTTSLAPRPRSKHSPHGRFVTPRLKYLQKWPHLKGNKEEGRRVGAWDTPNPACPQPQPRQSDGLFSAAASRNIRLSGQNAWVQVHRKVPKKAQGWAEVGLVSQRERGEGPGARPTLTGTLETWCPGR